MSDATAAAEPAVVPVIQTLGLSKTYGRRQAVRELDLQVPPGCVFGLLGQNGAGKSTTIRLLLGLIRPTRGEARLFGRNVQTHRLEVLRRVGCLVEGPAFYPYLTGAANLKGLGDLAGGVTRERVQQCLERVGLGDRGGDRYQGYSTGMRQRLGLAAAILHDPELVILDEPMSGLDPPAVLLVRRLVRSLVDDEGKTVILSSHILHEVELACDAVAVIEQGRVVAQGRVLDLLHPEHARLEVRLDRPQEAADLLGGLDYVLKVAPVGSTLHLELEGERAGDVNRALVEGGHRVHALIPHRRTLEELFHDLAGTTDDGGTA
jgi:ABC-2 type transport system ATP-binding protein